MSSTWPQKRLAGGGGLNFHMVYGTYTHFFCFLSGRVFQKELFHPATYLPCFSFLLCFQIFLLIILYAFFVSITAFYSHMFHISYFSPIFHLLYKTFFVIRFASI
uniref:Uncharacterized protein n=1 Tax=Cacopsylla melanoneura TaxID=428564 RepID=A0A8D9E1R6_9HEMI